jgi:hypothetical protein
MEVPMTVTTDTNGTIPAPEDARDEPEPEPDRFDRVITSVAELHGEIQEMRRELRRLANQLLAGLVEFAKDDHPSGRTSTTTR